MDRKGFTLTEVLGVVIIIVLISLLAFPPIMQQINKSKYELSETALQTIYHATENYLNNNQGYYNFLGGNVFCVNLDDLVESGYLKEGVVKLEVINNISSTRVVKVDVISKSTMEYDLVNTESCNEINNVTVINSDSSGASTPKLAGGMIPIRWDGSKWVKANYNNPSGEHQWYDYSNQKWANVVLVTNSSRENYKKAPLGTPIIESDVLAYFVWIPRFKYQLFNVDFESVSVQEINVEFESPNTPKSIGKVDDEYVNGQWLTHPAFTLGKEELTGFWVGKFETSTTQDSECYINPSISNCNNTSQIPLIKPTVGSLRYQSIFNQFETAKKFNDFNIYGTGVSNDAHMMRSLEWGAVAYLSHSKYGKYGNELYTGDSGLEKEVWNNPNNQYLTGCAGSSVDDINLSSCENYSTINGVKASTTGNVYGIYDMSGGAREYVLGNNGSMTGNSGYTEVPDDKYFDIYQGGITTHNQNAFNRSIMGDATGETRGWYSDYDYFVWDTEPWFSRGGYYNRNVGSGLFAFDYYTGQADINFTFRVVLLGS